MCDTCGCGDTNRVSVEVHTSLLSKNDRDAAHLRAHFEAGGVTTLNLMGSPGSGKTALLEATAKAFGGRYRLAAVSGDLATSHDADRLARAGIPSAAITTGTACHLEAAMVHAALHGPVGKAADACDFFFVENVGNLVCPAIYDLGQRANVVALSVTEGVDKPLKYPVMFRHADLVVLTKVDLLPYLEDVAVADIEAALAQVMPVPRLISVSARRGTGLDAWLAWLEEQRAARPARADAARLAPAATRPDVELGRGTVIRAR
ncbi:MAG: hydrogenase nickel incorporation protein HypB [Myxococcota bacterium]